MPIKKIGVIGGGQLAAMMNPAARNLSLELIVQTAKESDPAALAGVETILAPVDEAIATAKLAASCDVITFENEFINLEALKKLVSQGVCFRPSLASLAPLLDKYHQRRYLLNLGLPVPWFKAFDETEVKVESFPVVLKSRRHGYDGQGTFILHSQEELETVKTQYSHIPMLLEEYVPFVRELAVMAARNSQGDMAIYPVVETQQEQQVCRRVIVPAPVTPAVTAKVEEIARQILTELEFVGILGIEFFLTATEKVIVNEIAPRTHNSGHYTLDACSISQFETHLRAIANLPLNSPQLQAKGALMVNLLGYEYSYHDYQTQRHLLAQLPHTFVHWYGKSESHPGRKLGHVTTLLTTESELQEINSLIEKIEEIWYVSGSHPE